MAAIAAFFYEGGIWMVPIAFVSMLALAVIIERTYFLCFVYNTDAALLMNKIRQAIRSHQLAQGILACNEKPGAALSQVLKSGLESAQNGGSVEVAVEETSLDVIPLVQKRGNALAGLASLATLLGLLGTVMGLIEAFVVVADAPMDQKSVLLTKAISVAMNCTAFGLMVAIPCMLGQLLLGGVSKKIMDDLDTYSVKLENIFAARSGQGR